MADRGYFFSFLSFNILKLGMNSIHRAWNQDGILKRGIKVLNPPVFLTAGADLILFPGFFVSIHGFKKMPVQT